MQRKEIDKLVQALTSWEKGLARLGECIVQFQRVEDALSICISAMIGRSGNQVILAPKVRHNPTSQASCAEPRICRPSGNQTIYYPALTDGAIDCRSFGPKATLSWREKGD